MKSKTLAMMQAIYIVLMTDPAIILREPNDDPYAPWVIALAKAKRWLLPMLTGCILGALAAGVPLAVKINSAREQTARAEKERDSAKDWSGILARDLVKVGKERDTAWEMYRVLADEKNILEAVQ